MEDAAGPRTRAELRRPRSPAPTRRARAAGHAGRRDQRYCVDCGLLLPDGRAAGSRASRRGWLRVLGWYPGDWVWVGAARALSSRSAGAAVAIALSERRADERHDIVASSTAATAAIRRARAGRGPARARARAHAGKLPNGARARPDDPGRLTWPRNANGWTIVLVSYPMATRPAATPLETATRAARARPRPRSACSSRPDFSSLHPGYAIVFSGIYSSRADAEAALTSVRATGFGLPIRGKSHVAAGGAR